MASNNKKATDGEQASNAPSTATTAADAPAPALPARVKLVTPYGYYDDEGAPHFWMAGYETAKPEEIAEFVARGAEIEHLE